MPLAHEASTSRYTLDVEPDTAYLNGDACVVSSEEDRLRRTTFGRRRQVACPATDFRTPAASL